MLVGIGYGLGYIASLIPSDRANVVRTNLRLCFPDLDQTSLDQLYQSHWRLLGRSLVEKGIIWHGSCEQLKRMVDVQSEIDLCDRKPRILVNMHFTGIEGGIILSALAKENNWPRTTGFFQRMKDPHFNQKIIEWRNRFGGNALDREKNTIKLLREIKQGSLIFLASDIDLGTKDSCFAPFFGIPTNTVTTVSRLAQLSGAEVCLMTTTLKSDESGYLCAISKPLLGFPTNNPESDTARLNKLFEEQIRLRPAEYYWVHKRFKNRPHSEANPYQ